MRIKTKRAIQILKTQERWLPEQPPYRSVTRDRRVSNIVQGCLSIMAASISCDIRAWMARRPRRRKLLKPRDAAWTKDGRKAIRELLTLTISELEASARFRKQVDVGLLPLPEPKRSVTTPSAGPANSHLSGSRRTEVAH